MTSHRAQIGVELWRLYAEAGKRIPASWIARAVGVSPTTMTKHLAPEGYLPVRGYTPGRGWNWSRVRRQDIVETMVSNGKKFDFGEPVMPEEIDQNENYLLDFLSAIEVACDGMAVARMADCSRVIFKGEPNKPLQVGTMGDNGVCKSKGRYEPTSEDFETQDWMLMAVGPL